MIKSLFSKLVLLFLTIIVISAKLHAQKTVFEQKFDASETNVSTTSGTIPGSNWNVSRGGTSYGARIHNGRLNLTNDISSGSIVNGWVLASTSTPVASSGYRSILNQNLGIVSWTFNMRQSFPDPSGFSNNQYGVAYILAGTTNTTRTLGQGYAIQLGRSTTGNPNDPISLVRYTGGMAAFSTILSSEAPGPKKVGTNYVSVRVEYNPADQVWKLFVRDDGPDSFADPLTGSLNMVESGIHSSPYTGIDLPMTGAYWNAGNTSNDSFFDNITIKVVVPEITSITPAIKNVNSDAFTLTIDGKGFKQGNTVYWNGLARTTQYVSPTQLTASIPATDLTAPGQVPITVRMGTTYVSNAVNFEIRTPVITASTTTLPAFVSCAQTTSASQSFTISGSNLGGNIVVTPPTGFEVSKDAITYSPTLTFDHASGTVGSALVYVRMKPTSTAVSGNITVTSSQAATKNISVSGNIGATTTWNAATWSVGLPTSTTTAVINGAYNEAASINACSLTIKSGSVVVIPATFDVTLNGALTVESGASFTLASNTNLIQNTNVQNSGIINVQRKSSQLFRLDYTMWGSPLYGTITSTLQTLKNFSPNTVDSRFYTYNSSTDVFNSVLPTTPFEVGKGYLIRMPDNHTIFSAGVPATSWTGTFVGTPNNGDINVSLVYGQKGFNLLANPYPSMLDAKKFLTDNATQIGGTLYFWRRRNNMPTASETTSAYYATYTYAGGAAVAVSNSSSSTNGGQTFESAAPNGFIQVGQGFIVQKLQSSPAAGIVVFKNSMRTATNNDNQFFKNASIENSGRVWLNVTNAAGEFGQTLVAYLAEAENGLDFTDGKYLNDGSTALTSWLDNTEYIIQGRAPFESSDVVDLNFKTATAGTYTIAIDHVDGLFEVSQDIFLRDNVLNVLHDLKASSYTFATEAGSFNNRFDLVYLNPLAVDSPTFSSNSVVLFKNQNNIVINSGNNLLEMVEVFDIRGRVLAVAKNIQANEISINVGTTNQVLIVKITSADGITVTKKTIN
ncbi:T9SS sorting signal type C domain-containing protein [Flavobacterium ardleyense]|uniref:T9SS sorting signal type C domain-containing protein n=1 Tax=Flavobacterium ardleyense TaxID=2038737 RepID=UPI00298C7649|nr:T9SS sorting signal type C domain-containing protein [Flavobacterium ardleyense]